MKGEWQGFQEKEYDVEPLATVARIKEEIINSLNRGESTNNPSKSNFSRANEFPSHPFMAMPEYLSDDDDDDDDEDDYRERQERDIEYESNEMEESFNNAPQSDNSLSLDISAKPLSLGNSETISLIYNGVTLDDDITLVCAIQNASNNALNNNSYLSDASIHSWRQKHQFTLARAQKKVSATLFFFFFFSIVVVFVQF